jgi:uncharacterized membrane protein YgdD (TMEM256/DUF423 family)
LTEKWVSLGGVFAFAAVALGAFGAHGLETRLTPHLLEVFKTGAYYQMIHALALLYTGGRIERRPHDRRLGAACLLLAAGIVLFSGSLYVLALTGVRQWGIVTPLGGICFLTAWALFVAAELTPAPDRAPGE